MCPILSSGSTNTAPAQFAVPGTAEAAMLIVTQDRLWNG